MTREMFFHFQDSRFGKPSARDRQEPKAMSVPSGSSDKHTVCKGVGNNYTTNDKVVENCLERKLQERP